VEDSSACILFLSVATMSKLWVFRDTANEAGVDHLSNAINIDTVLSSILIHRGIQSFDEAKKYFRPQLDDLHDPFLMKGMEPAVERLGKAIRNNERILVYGDYDVDGTTSVVMMYSFLKKHAENIDFYIPDRYREGYGISEEGVAYAINNDISLIISLDCGIRAVENITMAADNRIDFIVCDHHFPGETLPPAIAILDPKQEDCDYPFKELSGCGIGFKLIQGFYDQQSTPEQSYAWLDLVAISICADIVPINGENRILTYHGLKKLNAEPLAGLRALMGVAGLKNDVDVSGVVFGIAPRINAAGRISHARDAVQLLLAESSESAVKAAEIVNALNIERKNYDVEITGEALKMIRSDSRLESAKSTVLFKESWHKGVIGIVASRVIEKYYRPTIILTESNNMATGSARSVDGFNVYSAIEACSGLLSRFGGHKYAAGVTLPLENVQKFQAKFEEIVAATISSNDLIPKLKIDATLSFEKINAGFFNIIRQMEPFGPANPSPVFITENVECINSRVIGDKHLKMIVKERGRKKTFEAIAFGQADLSGMIVGNQPIRIAYHIEENEFRDEKFLQLVIKDIKEQ